MMTTIDIAKLSQLPKVPLAGATGQPPKGAYQTVYKFVSKALGIVTYFAVK